MKLHLHSKFVRETSTNSKMRREQKTCGDDYLCGVSIFHTGPGDVFVSCCIGHDIAYDTLGCESTKEIDQIFLDCMRFIAGSSKRRKLQMWCYYCLARGYGMARYALCKRG